jgi:hypothetical protein
MRRLMPALLLAVIGLAFSAWPAEAVCTAVPGTNTTFLSLCKPTPGIRGWAADFNVNLDALDNALSGTTQILPRLKGATTPPATCNVGTLSYDTDAPLGSRVLVCDPANTWTALGGGGSGTVPTGTGFRHITAGAEDAAAKLVDTADINNNQVTLAKLADIATASFLGRTTAATGDPEVLTGTQATALLDVFSSTLKGLAPASGGGTTNFLRADGTWAAPPSGGPGTGTLNRLAKWGTTSTLGNSLLSDDGTSVTLISGQMLLPDGTAGAPAVSRTADATGMSPKAGRITFSIGGVDAFSIWPLSGGGGILVPSASPYAWDSSASVDSHNADLFLYRDLANTLACRNGVNACESRVYNIDSGTNDEFFSIDWRTVANRLTIGPKQTNTGTLRDMTVDYGAGVAFATLGTPAKDGLQVFCNNCLPNSVPCTGASTGKMAHSAAGVWRCD